MLDPLASTNAQHYYPIFRKAEVFLNYAEAANEAWGPKGKIRTVSVSLLLIR